MKKISHGVFFIYHTTPQISNDIKLNSSNRLGNKFKKK